MTTVEDGAPPRPLESARAAFADHLRLERDRSPHTLRAYDGDLRSLFAHATRLGAAELVEVDLSVLRSWLAHERTAGASRATLARRGSTARTFTAWAHRRGLLPTDPGQLLATPKGHRTLPEVLRVEEAIALVTVDGEEPEDHRDRAVLELLYATGIRVGELCGLDVDDLDPGRRVVRVFGKGRKERAVPYGLPAQEALDRWVALGRPRSARERASCAALPGRRRPGPQHRHQRRARAGSAGPRRTRGGCGVSGRARAGGGRQRRRGRTPTVSAALRPPPGSLSIRHPRCGKHVTGQPPAR